MTDSPNEKLADRLEAMLHQVGYPDYSLREFFRDIKLIVHELRSVPAQGMVMVPREPTKKMLASGLAEINRFIDGDVHRADLVYRAMLTAASQEKPE